MLVSIIVPVYNVEKYLRKCLDSVLNQTYHEIELIAVDDGSTDGSAMILNEYKCKDKRVKVVTKANGGLSSARNEGIKHADGEYIMFVDSDDYIRFDTVELFLNKALETGADLVACDMEYEYDDGTKILASGGVFELSSFKENNELLFINNSACNKFIHKKLLKDFEFPIGLWYEDLGSIPVLIVKSRKIAKVNEPLYVYYQRKGSIAHSASEKIFDIYKAINLVENVAGNIARRMYIIHGLDLTTIRIKDFDDESIKEKYMKKNIDLLNEYYPNWFKDPYLKRYSLKKKLIFYLLKKNEFRFVLKLYK